MSDRQLVGQPTGSSQASVREGAAPNGRTLGAGMSPVAGGGAYIGEDFCGATKKDGTICSSPKIKSRERCIGHLRGYQEGE